MIEPRDIKASMDMLRMATKQREGLEVINAYNTLQSENKALREQIEELKAEINGLKECIRVCK